MRKVNCFHFFSLSLMGLILSGCVGSPTSSPEPSSRYEMENDSPELEPFDLSSVKPIIPVKETRTRAGNKNPYTVNGETYTLMAPEAEAGYEEIGMASWYGRKFHGHLTSNGEVYDMFELTAAHKTLPIPAYLQVTNLENGKSIVVRVNDRGPFHSGRVVDLSYAAASMLGYADKGTTRVKVEAIIPDVALSEQKYSQQDDFQQESLEHESLEQEYLQIGAFSNLNSAQNIVAQVSNLTSLPVFIYSEPAVDSKKQLHRVRLGPLNETIEIQPLIQSIVDAKLGTPFKVKQ